VDRAVKHGVGRILNPGTNLQSSRDAVVLADEFPEVYAAVGIHPNEPVDLGADTIRELRLLADHPKVVAIGEIGLDYYRDQVSPSDQHRKLQAQLDLAAELSLPVIVHCREAYKDMCEIVEDWQDRGGPRSGNVGVFHSFSGYQRDAQAVLALGFYLGITGLVTFPKSDGLRRTVTTAPLERLLIETDAPFLTPQLRRGKRNEPSYVRWIADTIATQRDIKLAPLARATTRNAETLFAWDDLR